MEQRCHLSAVWLTWLGLPLLVAVTALRAGVLAAVIVLVAGILAQVLYLRWFPHVSRWIGYGSVDDEVASPAFVPRDISRVTLYTANVCPFCPIVRRRLAALQQYGGFDIEEVDVTFRPELIRAKGIRSVPVLEANGRLLVGNVTSAQLQEFLSAAAGPRELART